MESQQDDKLLQQELVNVMRRMRRVKMNVLSEQVIYTEYQALDQISRYVREHPDSGGIYVSELARSLNIMRSAASRLLNTMEGKGFISREVDKKDRRNTFVRLTPAGERILTQTAQDMDELKAQLIRRMGHEDILRLIKLWNRLATIMEDELDSLAKRRAEEGSEEL